MHVGTSYELVVPTLHLKSPPAQGERDSHWDKLVLQRIEELRTSHSRQIDVLEKRIKKLEDEAEERESKKLKKYDSAGSNTADGGSATSAAVGNAAADRSDPSAVSTPPVDDDGGTGHAMELDDASKASGESNNTEGGPSDEAEAEEAQGEVQVQGEAEAEEAQGEVQAQPQPQPQPHEYQHYPQFNAPYNKKMVKDARNRLKRCGKLPEVVTNENVIEADRVYLRRFYQKIFDRYSGRPRDIIDRMPSLETSFKVTDGFVSAANSLLGDSHNALTLNDAHKISKVSKVKTHFRFPLYPGELELKVISSRSDALAEFHILRFLYAIAANAHVVWNPIQNQEYAKRRRQQG